MSNRRSVHRLWAAVACCLVACAIGLLARYETAHYVMTGAASSCRVSETFDCDAVQTSEYGKLLGMSVSLWAVAGSGLLVALLLLVRRLGDPVLRLAGLLAGVNALVSLVYLAISLFALGADCLYCNGIQLMSVVAGVLVVPDAMRAKGGGDWALVLRAASISGALLLLLAVMGEAYATGHERLGLLAEETGGAAMRVGVVDALVIGDPVKASQNSFLVYFDFGCPRCLACYHSAVALQKKHPDRVHFFFKHWPLDKTCNPTLYSTKHPGSCSAARASQAAELEGRTAEVMRMLFGKQDFSPPELRDLGPRLGIDPKLWKSLRESADVKEQVLADVAEGNKLDFGAVPQRFRNGRRVPDLRLRRR